MAVIKLASGNYQARLTGSDGRIISEVFMTKLEAEEQVFKWKRAKREGTLKVNTVRLLTVGDYFAEWWKDVSGAVSVESDSGWRFNQLQLYRDYVQPTLEKQRLSTVRPASIQRIMITMATLGRSEQTRIHVFNLLRKMFGDAIENYEYLTFNPVLRKFKPKLPQKESRHLNLEQLIRLLQHVEGKRYGDAIWLQLFLGLRVGEVLGLRWEDIDLTDGRLIIRRCYVRTVNSFREYPKGGKQHSHSIPVELLDHLAKAKKIATEPLVVTSPEGSVVPYNRYLSILKEYCQEIGLPCIGTHGLRHSTSELYMKHGATKDDLQRLFAHSSPEVTARYLHGRNTNLENVAKVIRLFDKDRPRKSTMTTNQAEVSEGK